MGSSAQTIVQNLFMVQVGQLAVSEECIDTNVFQVLLKHLRAA